MTANSYSVEALLAHIHDPELPGFHLCKEGKTQLSRFIIETRTALSESQRKNRVAVEALKRLKYDMPLNFAPLLQTAAEEEGDADMPSYMDGAEDAFSMVESRLDSALKELGEES